LQKFLVSFKNFLPKNDFKFLILFIILFYWFHKIKEKW